MPSVVAEAPEWRVAENSLVADSTYELVLTIMTDELEELTSCSTEVITARSADEEVIGV